MINQDTEFTHFIIEHNSYDERYINGAYLVNGLTNVEDLTDIFSITIKYFSPASDQLYHFDETDPEIQEILRRVKAGTCEVLYWFEDRIKREDEEPYWILSTHPIHKANQHLFLTELNGGYVAPNGDEPAEFHVPGIVKHQAPFITFHKYTTSNEIPAPRFEGDRAAFIAAMADEGWTEAIPYNVGTLKRLVMEIGFADQVPTTVILDGVQTVVEVDYYDAARVRRDAKRVKEWEDSLPETPDAEATRAMTWARTWLGYCWNLTNNIGPISLTVIETDGSTRTLGSRHAIEFWALSHIERWLDRGLDQMTMDATVQTRLSGRRLTQIEDNGSAGEYNNFVYIQSTWDDFHDLHYWGALGYIKPGPPQNLSTTQIHNEAHLSWALPTVGTAPENYDIQYRETGAANWIDVTHTTTDRTVVVTGLTASTRYEWQVRASNLAGTSDWASGGTFTTEVAPPSE